MSEAKKDFQPDDDAPAKDAVAEWLTEMQADAEFNTSAYVDCFLSENLVRKYIVQKQIQPNDGVKKRVTQFKDRENKTKQDANISFAIRKTSLDLSYLDMDDLAFTAEGSKNTNTQSLWGDAVGFKPVRNAVGHTGRLTQVAKTHLNMTFENIKARIRTLLSD